MKKEIANGFVYAGLILMAATVAFMLAGLFYSKSGEMLCFWINCTLFSLFSGVGVAIVGVAIKSVFSLEYVKSR